MEEKIDTGGPAFPGKQKALMIKSEHIGIANEYEIEHNGMTLRDYFAAKVMASIICQKDSNDGGLESKNIAWLAYQMADAMLKARK